jgi:hypothetical protein
MSVVSKEKSSCSLNEQELKMVSYHEIITGPPKAVRRGSSADSGDSIAQNDPVIN